VDIGAPRQVITELLQNSLFDGFPVP